MTDNAPTAAPVDRLVRLPFVLDACCGPRMMWFDKMDDRVTFLDVRDCDYTIAPDRAYPSGTVISVRPERRVMALKTIEQEWEDFSGMIFAKMEPSPVQVKETKQAFFAGAWAILCAVKQLGEPEISEDAGVQFLEDRQQEGTAFYRELMKRYADCN